VIKWKGKLKFNKAEFTTHAGVFQVLSDYTGSSLDFIDLSQKIREVAVKGQLSKICLGGGGLQV
jgi:hypothetical protein